MLLRLRMSTLRESTPMEWVQRFLFGGTVTVIASLVAQHYGPVIGGLFLAFPGIFPASVCLVEKHKIKREQEQGNQGVRSARGEASVEAAGASLGALGLAGFALVLWKGVPRHGLFVVLLCATFVWMAVSWLLWRARERM